MYHNKSISGWRSWLLHYRVPRHNHSGERVREGCRLAQPSVTSRAFQYAFLDKKRHLIRNRHFNDTYFDYDTLVSSARTEQLLMDLTKEPLSVHLEEADCFFIKAGRLALDQSVERGAVCFLQSYLMAREGVSYISLLRSINLYYRLCFLLLAIPLLLKTEDWSWGWGMIEEEECRGGGESLVDVDKWWSKNTKPTTVNWCLPTKQRPSEISTRSPHSITSNSNLAQSPAPQTKHLKLPSISYI